MLSEAKHLERRGGDSFDSLRSLRTGSSPSARLRMTARVAGCLLAAVALFFALDALFPFPLARLRRQPATVVFDRNGDPMRIILPPDQKFRTPVSLDELPPELTRAVLASEDRWFWRHPGVNPVAIIRAASMNARARRRVSGASTIPMQIARMVEPKSRTIIGKAREAFRAVQLTIHATK